MKKFSSPLAGKYFDDVIERLSAIAKDDPRAEVLAIALDINLIRHRMKSTENANHKKSLRERFYCRLFALGIACEKNGYNFGDKQCKSVRYFIADIPGCGQLRWDEHDKSCAGRFYVGEWDSTGASMTEKVETAVGNLFAKYVTM